MYRVEEGYLLAYLFKEKVKYFHEEFVTRTELLILCQKINASDLPIVCVGQDDLEDYFTYHDNIGCYTIKKGLQLSDILSRFLGYMPIEVLKVLYANDWQIFMDVEKMSLREQERELERKKLLLKQAELQQMKQSGKSR